MINKKLPYRLLAALFIFIFLCTPIIHAGKVQIPEDTELKVKFDPGMNISSGNLQQGIPLLIYLAEPVEIGGKIIIEEGDKNIISRFEFHQLCYMPQIRR